MKKTFVLTMIFVLTFGVMAFARPEFTAQHAEVAPVIDGVLDEVWANAPVFELTMENYEAIGGSYASRGPGGFDAGGQFRVMWDEEYLYLFADVADRDGTYDANLGTNFINNNCLQVCMKPNLESEDKWIFDLIATSNAGTPLVWENWVIPGNVDLPIGGQVFFGGFTIEVAFPWEILNPSAVGEGVSFPFGPFIIDASDSGDRRGFLFPWEGADGAIGSPDEWNIVTLVK
mgnify:CR=1 FL=1